LVYISIRNSFNESLIANVKIDLRCSIKILSSTYCGVNVGGAGALPVPGLTVGKGEMP
jgi:hypothetical protein